MQDDINNNISNNGTTIHELPDEILDLVFSYLSTYNIKRNVSCVCKRWYNLSKKSVYLADLFFGPKLSTAQIVEIVRKAYALTKLELYSRKDVAEILPFVAQNSRRLQCLKISTGKAAKECNVASSSLISFLTCCPYLKKLVVKRTTIEDCSAFFSTFGKLCTQLKYVNFNHSLQFGTEDLMDLVNDCQGLVDVRLYCLAINRIGSLSPYGDVPVMALCHKMSETLAVLKLNALGLSDAIMPFVVSCQKIHTLHLYRMVNIHDDGLSMLADLPNLRQLSITMPRVISASCWQYLFSSANFHGLEKLTVSNSHTFDDEVLETLAEHCRDLTDIGLPGCRKITQRGTSTIFLCCTKLRSVNLFSTKSCIVSSFNLIPVHLPYLRVLTYRAIDRAGVQFPDFLKDLGRLQLKHYYRYI